MTDVDFNARLLELAHARDWADRAQQAYDVILIKHEALFGKEAQRTKERADELEAAIRADALAYVQATGDLHPHPSITFRRATKWMYDKADALETAQIGGRSDLVRTVASLDVRAFEKALDADELPGFDAEKINAPQIVIGKLGDLLIHAEEARKKEGDE